MTYHIWGDEWFKKYGDQLYSAQSFIYSYVKKWTRCVVITKEKYGTIRYEYIFAPGGSIRFGPAIKLPAIFDKHTTYGRCPRFLFIWNQCWVYRTWIQLGKRVLKRAIRIACEKYPDVKDEILADADIECIIG